MRPRLSTTVAVVAFALTVSGLFYRASRSGLELRDFRDGVYYAVVALLEGNNPYDAPSYLRTYPVEQAFSPYAPAFLLLHLPFGLLPYEAAQVAYFFTLTGLTVLLAALTLHLAGRPPSAAACLLLASAMLLVRPGSWNLGLGQYALQFGIAAVLVLGFVRRRPAIAALGLAIALVKPTYGLPLALLLVATQRWRVLGIGAGASVLLSLPPLLLLLNAAGGFSPFVDALWQSYANFATDPTAGAASGPERVDVIGLIGRALGRQPPAWLELAATLAVLGTGMAAYRWAATATSSLATSPLVFAIGALTIVICVYHQTYDLPILFAPLLLLILQPPAVTRHWRVLLIVLLALPMLNYLSPQAVQSRLGTTGVVRALLTSLNGIVLLAAFALALVEAGWAADTGDQPARDVAPDRRRLAAGRSVDRQEAS